MVSIQVLATPIRGRLRSASVNPMALNMERAPARSRPAVIPRLMCLRSIVKDYTTHGSDGKRESNEPRRTRSYTKVFVLSVFPCVPLCPSWFMLFAPRTKNGEPARQQAPQDA